MPNAGPFRGSFSLSSALLGTTVPYWGRLSEYRACLERHTILSLVQCLPMSNLTTILDQLQQERSRLQSHVEALSNAIASLNGTGNIRAGRRLSAAARARIAAAQRARWAKAKGKVVSIASIRKRAKMSPAALARIRAAQNARWAKWRKANKRVE